MAISTKMQLKDELQRLESLLREGRDPLWLGPHAPLGTPALETSKLQEAVGLLTELVGNQPPGILLVNLFALKTVRGVHKTPLHEKLYSLMDQLPSTTSVFVLQTSASAMHVQKILRMWALGRKGI